MGLTLRGTKGSEITITEMDSNFEFLRASFNSSNTNIDWSIASVQETTLQQENNFTFSGATIGQKIRLILKQNISGDITLVFPENVIWHNSISPSLNSLAASGTQDESFSIGAGFNNFVNKIKIQTDDKILVGGNFTDYDGNAINRLVRINSDGTYDDTFAIESGFNGEIYSLQVQSDGKIFAGGSFTTLAGETASAIVRLNSDGTRDNSFDSGNGFNDAVLDTVLLPNGKLVCIGLFTIYDKSSVGHVVRINSDGVYDSLSPYRNFNNIVRSLLLQEDNKIIFGGDFTQYGTDNYNLLIRIDSDGITDTSFVVGTGFGGIRPSVLALAIQSDGKIIVGGSFTSYNGASVNNIVRLNSDGTLDDTFITGTGFDSSVLDIKILSDGKIICGGDFTIYNETTSNRIIRLNIDGSIDTAFTTSNGFDSVVKTIEVQADGKLVVGGHFESYSESSFNRLIRLIGEITPEFTVITFDHNVDTYYIGSTRNKKAKL